MNRRPSAPISVRNLPCTQEVVGGESHPLSAVLSMKAPGGAVNANTIRSTPNRDQAVSVVRLRSGDD